MSHPNSAPLCKNCVHFNRSIAFPKCLAPALRTYNLVQGEVPANCHPERESGTVCGPAGLLFVSRHGANAAAPVSHAEPTGPLFVASAKGAI